jgi:hypothetical protein
MSFSASWPDKGDRQRNEVRVPGHGGYRLVSERHDPIASVATYVWSWDDDPREDQLNQAQDKCAGQAGRLDWTTLEVSDSPQGACNNDHNIDNQFQGIKSMYTPGDESQGPLYGFVGGITTCVYDGKGRTIPKGEGRRDTEKPQAKVSFDPARHVIRITEPSGKIAEFDDRPTRFLVLGRDPVTRALEPVIVRGEPLYYYLSREVER